ncbi:hypothetical protein L1987_80983 [Smallanthus sonchifolius]|uniref:Uncharacterized protein n=1 Tax=Smallanthus sonchifolius TaxID=185202 RepID=A0ACB8YPL5_9ASTR|nr:hypothetical protein L1987_80983 [Smallanthus sonchifolius]
MLDVTGFIASHVTNLLVSNYPNYTIVALDKLSYCSSLKNLQPCFTSSNFKFVKEDITSSDLINYLLDAEEIDTIMHFAAETHVDNSRINRFIHVSTDEVYGESDLETDIGNSEASQLLPTNPYSATKADAEMLKTAHYVHDRPFNDKLYFLDDQKLKKLAWEERTPWEAGLRMTIAWYRETPDWWGNVESALQPHPRISPTVPSHNEEEFLMQHQTGCSNNEIKFLIYGRTGWIGGLLGKLCMDKGIPDAYGRGKLQDRKTLLNDIRMMQPTHVFNAAGVTGRPNVDWCETHKVETIRTNVDGTLNLANVCKQEGSGIGFKEEDTPNFTGSFYSKTKAMVEEMLRDYDSVCTLRLRMPISSDLNNSRNFITKITRYNKVVNIPNSMSVLDELLPMSIEMANRRCKGVWNFTNPGVVSHNEILELYREYIDPKFKWVNFDLEEQAKVILAPRSNNELDVSKLKKEFLELLSIKDSITKYVFKPEKRVK